MGGKFAFVRRVGYDAICFNPAIGDTHWPKFFAVIATACSFLLVEVEHK